MGAINMLEMAKRVGARILQASTSEIYGDPLIHPQTEDYFGNVNTIGMRSCYDEGKRVAETLFMDYHRQNRVDTRIVRIFNAYGPRMQEDDGRVVSNFIVQALRGEALTIYGTGEQTRSFCYVDDLVEGIIRLMNTEKGSVHLPINIGNPGEFTMNELAAEVDDPKQRKPNIERAHSLLDWSPTVSLSEGLKRTVAYFIKLMRQNSEERISDMREESIIFSVTDGKNNI
jgi:UDP-glucuronate decarboxylase